MEQSSEYSSIPGFSSTSSVNIAPRVIGNALGILSGIGAYGGSGDASIFSSSLPVLSHEKLSFTEPENDLCPTDDTLLKLDKQTKDVRGKVSIGEVDLSGIRTLLPDDEEELLAGIADTFDLSGLPNQVDVEDCDLFGSGGGMELDFDPSEGLTVGIAKTSISDGYSGNGILQFNNPTAVGAVAGEHPYGEHPSRTLFVRNINSNVEDSELRSLFEQYGDIRTLYTACKHRGFVMISYYDIRAARTAMRALQNKPLRRRKLDIHFSIPKENPSEKDMNQGTLVAFNLDPSVTNDDLRQIFGAYGEVKEIRETPHKRHHKFIEYYDVRSAEAALRSLNRSDIAGKRIKLEPSRPGGARRNLIQQLNQDQEHDDCRSFRHQVGSPITNSPPGILAAGSWAQFNSPNDNSPLWGLSQSPTFDNSYHSGLSTILPSLMSNSLKTKPIGKEQSKINRGAPQHSHSFGPTTSSASPAGTLTGPEFLWGSPTTNFERSYSSAWSASSVEHSTTSNGLRQGFPYSGHQGSFIASSHPHVGSAPTCVPFEGHSSYFPESPELSYMNQVAFGSTGFGRNPGDLLINMGSPGRPSKVSENGLPSFRMISPRPGISFLRSPHYPASGSAGTEGFYERSRIHQVDNNEIQLDSKKQFELDLEKIVSGEDSRTTLMIKNIPNKYTSKMLLAYIDESHRGTYDFFYLPIDFKNKCNVGYAFINMVSPAHIVPLYQDFNGKKWEKFNSEKVATLAYARIQGKSGLVAHFQNSSLINEDKQCRPILFHSEGDEVVDQEFIVSDGLNICVRQQDVSFVGTTT